MSEKKILTKEILEHRLIPIEDFDSMTHEAASLYAKNGKFQSQSWASNLNWLKELTTEISYSLSQSEKWIKSKNVSLGGLDKLSAECAEHLALHKGESIALDGLTDLSTDAASKLVKYQGQEISLNSLQLSPQVAKGLANLKGTKISFKGVSELSEELASEIANFKASQLVFTGVNALVPGAANHIAKFEGEINLSNLEEISLGDAEAFSECKGRIDLSGMCKLSDEAALALGNGNISGLNLPPEILEQIQKVTSSKTKEKASAEASLSKEDFTKIRKLIKTQDGEQIAFAGNLLKSLDANWADYLKLFPKTAVFKLLSTWEPKIWDSLCEILSLHEQTLVLLKEQIEKRVNSKSQDYSVHHELNANLSNLCEHCDGKALELLAELRTDENWVSSLTNSDSHIALAKSLVLNRNNDPEYSGLGLDGVTELHEEPARELIKLNGLLSFKCLDELSDPLAEILSTHKYGLHFSMPSMPSLGDGLVKLSDQAAESFSRHQGKLELQSLKELSEKGAEHLSKHPNLVINARGDQQEIADLILSKRGPLTKEIVERFLEDDQSVRLDGYPSINEDAVDALSSYQGDINLDGLKEISDKSLQKLSSHKSWLSLRGLTELTDAQAESLSRYGQDVSHLCILSLIGLKNLSDTAAQFLAKTKGRVDVVEELEEKINQYRES